MDIAKKILEKIDKMIKIKGFYITEPGDPSVGMFPSTWKLDGDFIFDNEDEMNLFKADLKKTFENYCGEFVKVETIDEVEFREREFDFLG